ncbi:hypothetical protein EVAR_10947_1 [Eumeta japonica]|uniref:Uncharacterized protein n=1 Tax=Eumeta variegata TaxID=151549 RepID=A0A4C1U635_EUMVA|nr:hypothetical protein EVAR_10947_1 [Eumeta japonica]
MHTSELSGLNDLSNETLAITLAITKALDRVWCTELFVLSFLSCPVDDWRSIALPLTVAYSIPPGDQTERITNSSLFRNHSSDRERTSCPLLKSNKIIRADSNGCDRRRVGGRAADNGGRPSRASGARAAPPSCAARQWSAGE